jgi:hypothetical protein
MAAARRHSKSRAKSKAKRASRSSEISAAISAGESLAQQVLTFRKRQLQRRAALQPGGTRRRRAPGARGPAATALSFGAPATAGVLIAEGDSWFDYPLHDVLRMLEDDFFFDVESVAHRGDCIEDMAHSKGQFEEFARRLEKLLRAGKVPKAILLSGGGNDIAGDEFAILLNHAASPLPPLNEDIIRGVIDVRLQTAYASIISGLTAICMTYVQRPVPIIVHGYDHPVPDGRGFLGGFWFLPGPWLRPGFERKGHGDVKLNTGLIEDLIDRFNDMLQDVVANPQFRHVHYLNLRDTLKNDGTYKKFWANELHPTERGFDLVTKKFADLIAQL